MSKSEIIAIRLSTSEREILNQKIEEGGFKTATDFFRQLVFSEENSFTNRIKNNQDVLLNHFEKLEIHLTSMENSLKEFAGNTVSSTEEILEKFYEMISKYMYKNLLYTKIIHNLINSFLMKFKFADDPKAVERWKQNYDHIFEKSKEILDGELKEND